MCAGGQGRALIGARVKVLCDDECFYEGRVDGWTGSEWKIVLDDGELACLHEPTADLHVSRESSETLFDVVRPVLSS